ncbi:MAG: RdgB/HAM1 family non-canonical purine NTP pyrophosphatase [Myxococcales bacterium]|nr:RdgB/HAM1 family non-canonical purine NTP pyrophosphatase [Myxococcales bacterium]
MSDASPYRELVVATSNPGKLLEFRALLGELPLSLRILSAFPEVLLPEEGDDYTENAIAKAETSARETGRPALADDSGLEVDALGGRPGVRSARYGGPELSDPQRTARLLEELSAAPEGRRSARFVCVAALALPDGRTTVRRGVCEGRILGEARGAAGFGYDPIFAPEGEDRALAELPAPAKNRISHRGRALAELTPVIREWVLAPERS